MAKSVAELEQIVIQLNKDLIEWQKWCRAMKEHVDDFKTWTMNELNRMKAGRPNAVTQQPQPVRRDIRDLQMEMLMKQLRTMGNDLDCISADLSR